jgi:hypothetical protein
MAATREFLNGMAMGKVRLERYQRLRDLAKRIVADPHSIDDDTKAALKAATMKYARMLHDDPTQALEVLYHDQDGLGALVRKAVEVIADHDAVDQHDRVPVVDHHASKVADLLVEAGSHPDRAAALQHLLHKPSGQALLARMSKAAEPAKDPPMDTVHSIMKAGSVAGVCAAIVAKGTTTISEREIVDAVSRIASERWPQLTEAQGFSKILEAPTEEARVLQHALKIAKAAEFSVFEPRVFGREAVNPDNPGAMLEAYQEILRTIRERWPFRSPAQQLAATDEELARRFHVRPQANYANAYAPPASPERATKFDRDPVPNTDSAYAALMCKAEEYRAAHPNLSVAQSFEKIYTDRTNIELAKRERSESAPR